LPDESPVPEERRKMAGPYPPPADAYQPEQVLLSFGPLGVSVCKGSYSMWKWQRKNATVIELTSLGIRGVPVRGLASRGFEIPYSSIVSLRVYGHPARLGLMQVFDVHYRAGTGVEELSICAYKRDVRHACDILGGFAGQAFTTSP
jgi:hypothetical protein